MYWSKVGTIILSVTLLGLVLLPILSTNLEAYYGGGYRYGYYSPYYYNYSYPAYYYDYGYRPYTNYYYYNPRPLYYYDPFWFFGGGGLGLRFNIR